MTASERARNHLLGLAPKLWRVPGKVQEVAESAGASTRTVRRVRQELEGRQLKRDEAMGQTDIPRHIRSECVTLSLYDGHFPHEDWETIEIAIDHALTRFKVDTLVLGGDFADFHSISRWKRDPYDMPFHEEIAYTASGIARIADRIPKAKKFYIKGNHEDRLQTYLWTKAPEIARLKGMTVPEQLELESSGFRWVDNIRLKEETGRFFQIGRLNMLHGHELGICPIVNPAHRYLLKALDNVMVGHVHKSNDDFMKTLQDKTIGAFVVGACCDMNPNYRPQNDWQAGFAVTEFDADGFFRVNNYRIIEGRVL